MSNVEIDNEKNQETLKKSRHSRNIKKETSDSEDTEKKNYIFKQKFNSSIPVKCGNNNYNEEVVHSTLNDGEINNKVTDFNKSTDDSSLVTNKSIGKTVPIIPESATDDSTLTNCKSNAQQQVIPGSDMESNSGKTKTQKRSYATAFSTLDQNLGELTPYEDVILNKLNRIGTTTELMSRQLQNIPQINANGFPIHSFSHKNKDLQIFPIDDEETFKKVDRKLAPETEYFTKVFTALKAVGKYSNSSLTVNAVMKEIFTLNMGDKFCLTGKNKNQFVFRDTIIYKVVSQSLLHILPEETTKNRDDLIGTWLSNCKGRILRKEKENRKSAPVRIQL
ncbi:uncharacterized protein LOC127276928 [Leptopilina boulardi]|uniref:uncharacterized protein LOC127276928 n=1 Tax=Leptopilina boulardi TaxID=63433 RepID=UPI0021F5970D|nr:uncharacterized protein LOC127276928 [Leptopilina boulardi]